MSEDKFMLQCFMCRKEFQFSPHIYAGRHIPAYNITVCDTCYKSNWDGWAPHYERKLIEHLKKENLPIPERNEKGWLPRDGEQ